MKRFVLSIVLAMLTCCLLNGCSDDPNDVGVGLLPTSDAVNIDSVQLKPSSTRTDTSRIIGSTSTLLLGAYQFGNTVFDTAKLLLDFRKFPESSFPIIDSATISFSINYRFKVSTEEFGFSANQIFSSWSPDTLTWDKAAQFNIGSTTLGKFGEQIITPTDSTVTIRFDSLSWLRSDSSSIILTPSLNTNIILGFNNLYTFGIDYRPKLTISYRDSSNDTTTKSYTVGPYRSLYLANSTSIQPPVDSMFVIQSAVAYRGQLKFSIPESLKQKHASITQAVLDIYLDSASSIRDSSTNNSIEARLASDSTITPKLSSLNARATPNARNVFSFDVKNFVQLWTTGGPNYGIVLRATNEFISFDRFRFFGAQSDSSHRPKLKITYTVLPSKRTAR